MQIKSTPLYTQDSAKNETALSRKLHSGDLSGKVISETYLAGYSLQVRERSQEEFKTQNIVRDFSKLQEMLDTIDTAALGYEGKKLSQLTPEEATALIAPQGFFGIEQTSKRLIDFVLGGAKENLDLLRAGREGIVRGFNEAESVWGSKLPDIAYQTLAQALKGVDEKITFLGGNLLDASV